MNKNKDWGMILTAGWIFGVVSSIIIFSTLGFTGDDWLEAKGDNVVGSKSEALVIYNNSSALSYPTPEIREAELRFAEAINNKIYYQGDLDIQNYCLTNSNSLIIVVNGTEVYRQEWKGTIK